MSWCQQYPKAEGQAPAKAQSGNWWDEYPEAGQKDAWEHQQEVDRFFREYDQLSRQVAGFGKRPLTQEIIRRGGIDPSSPVAGSCARPVSRRRACPACSAVAD